jgi:hypothetical protein
VDNAKRLMSMSARELAAEFNLRVKGKAGEMECSMDSVRMEIQRRASISGVLDNIRREANRKQRERAGEYGADDPEED